MREKAEKPAKRKLTRNQRKQIEAVIRQTRTGFTSRYRKYQARVQRISGGGTDSTKRWYKEYQSMVRAIPRDGTSATTRRYDRYHRVKQTSVPGI